MCSMSDSHTMGTRTTTGNSYWSRHAYSGEGQSGRQWFQIRLQNSLCVFLFFVFLSLYSPDHPPPLRSSPHITYSQAFLRVMPAQCRSLVNKLIKVSTLLLPLRGPCSMVTLKSWSPARTTLICQDRLKAKRLSPDRGQRKAVEIKVEDWFLT